MVVSLLWSTVGFLSGGSGCVFPGEVLTCNRQVGRWGGFGRTRVG